mgnify:FL=1
MSSKEGEELCDKICEDKINKSEAINRQKDSVAPQLDESTNNKEENRNNTPLLGDKNSLNNEKIKPSPISTKPDVRFRVANGKYGAEYDNQIEILNEYKVNFIKVDGLEEVGLKFDPSSNRIIGKISREGTFILSVYFSLKDAKNKQEYNSSLGLYIAPDPRSLWKDDPSDNSIAYWKSDTDCKGIELEDDYRMVAASRRGRSHAHEGTPRDDDFCIHETTVSGWHVLAVADGAGSAKYSREGSRIAVERSTDLLTAKLDENSKTIESLFIKYIENSTPEHHDNLEKSVYSCIKDPVYNSVTAIYEQVKSNGEAEFRDFYTTLLIGAHKEISGKHCVIGYWRGDGAIAYHVPNKELKLLGKPDGGEYAGQTRFLDKEAMTQEDILKRVSFGVFDHLGSLILMTDGISDPKFESDDDLAELSSWNKLWNNELEPILQISNNVNENAKDLLEWMNFWSKGNHDDRTLAILHSVSTLNKAEKDE